MATRRAGPSCRGRIPRTMPTSCPVGLVPWSLPCIRHPSPVVRAKADALDTW